ncbi:MAG: TIGR00159 family protein, partial [Ruminococcus sp.]|nr:TIGR00159 family protein [Ruminococcus sp.]
MQQFGFFLENNLTSLHMPSVRALDIAQMLIIAFLIYEILVWAKTTRLWSLLKGVVVIIVFIVIAAAFNMTTILWIVQNVFGIAVTAMVVILQPELRKALEGIGRRNFFHGLFNFSEATEEGRFSDKTINEI